MSVVDAGLVVGVVFFTLRGYSRGLFGEILSLAIIVAGLAVAFAYGPQLVGRAGPYLAFLPGGLLVVLAFAILYIATVVIVRIVVRLFRRLWLAAGISPLNRLGGGVFGLLKGALLLGTLILAVNGTAPLDDVRGRLPAEAKAAVEAFDKRLAASTLAGPLAGLTGPVVSAVITGGTAVAVP